MERPPPKLRILSFARHAARGLVRDQTTRRRVMFFTTLAAMLMVFLGATFFLRGTLAREHPIWFFLFWMACGWITFTAVLLAAFDLLMVRMQARRERRRLRGQLEEE